MAKTPQTHITGTLDDGTSFDVQTTPADQIRYELTAAKQGWPGLKDGGAAFLWGGFLAWSACKRTGQTDLKWEEFRDSLAALDMDTDSGDDVDPTEGSDPEPFD